jgi:hypothetical protein
MWESSFGPGTFDLGLHFRIESPSESLPDTCLELNVGFPDVGSKKL